jgi:hypothetical protein
MKLSEQPTEAEVRQLRANIYGEVSDESWNKVKENWMKPSELKWLISQNEKKLVHECNLQPA